jgi:hypothetical protein
MLAGYNNDHKQYQEIHPPLQVSRFTPSTLQSLSKQAIASPQINEGVIT